MDALFLPLEGIFSVTMAHGDTHYKIKSDSVEAIASRLHPKVMVLFIYLFVCNSFNYC